MSSPFYQALQLHDEYRPKIPDRQIPRQRVNSISVIDTSPKIGIHKGAMIRACGCDTRSHGASGLADGGVGLCPQCSSGPVLEACPHPDVRRW